MLSGMQAQEAPQIGRTETDFYRNSVRMGKECEKDGGYWDSNVEMTARAFACYIKDKLPTHRIIWQAMPTVPLPWFPVKTEKWRY